MPRLPMELLKIRVREEVQRCQDKLLHEVEVTNPSFSGFPVELRVTIKNTPAPVLKEGILGEQFTHVFIILITEQYPYEKPKVQWQTPIFHPNIKLPKDGGHVCSRLIDNWSCRSNLVAFIKGIETLISNPNPQNPWGTNSCTLSAEYFNKNQYTPSTILINILNGQKIVNKE